MSFFLQTWGQAHAEFLAKIKTQKKTTLDKDGRVVEDDDEEEEEEEGEKKGVAQKKEESGAKK